MNKMRILHNARVMQSCADGKLFIDQGDGTLHEVGGGITELPEHLQFGEKTLSETVLFEEQTIELDGGRCAEILPFVLDDGKEYIIRLDGKEYRCTAHLDEYEAIYVLIGFDGTVPFGFEFYIYNEGTWFDVFDEATGEPVETPSCTLAVSVLDESVSPIGMEYLPEALQYGSITEQLFSMPECNFIDDSGFIYNEYPMNVPMLKPGQVYTVTWDGVDYKRIAFSDGMGCALGNKVVGGWRNAVDTGEPFYIFDNGEPGEGGAYVTAAGMHSVSISKTTVNTIDKECLPEHLQFGHKGKVVVDTEIFFQHEPGGRAPFSLGDVAEGKRYIVSWAGIDYDCVMYYSAAHNALSLGNESLYRGSNDTGEPFYICTNDGFDVFVMFSGGLGTIVKVVITECVPIDAKYLPDSLQFWSNKTETTLVTWDGVVGDKTVIEIEDDWRNYVKVSDLTPSAEELLNSVAKIHDYGNIYSAVFTAGRITATENYALLDPGGYDSNGLITIVYAPCEIDGIVFDEPGIYNMFSDTYYLTSLVLVHERVVTINPKYLPVGSRNFNIIYDTYSEEYFSNMTYSEARSALYYGGASIAYFEYSESETRISYNVSVKILSDKILVTNNDSNLRTVTIEYTPNGFIGEAGPA